MLKAKLLLKVSILSLVLLILACASSTKMADNFFKEKNYRAAIYGYQQSLKKDPANVNAWINLGKSYQALGILDSARLSLRKAYHLKPNNPAVKHLLLENDFLSAKKLARDKNYRWEAVQKLSSVLEKDSTYLPAIVERGKIYESLGQFGPAAEDYHRALQLDPALVDLKQKIERFQRLTQESGEWTAKAKRALRVQKYLTAVEALKEALTIKPDNKQAQYLLYITRGRYYLKRGSLSRIWDAIEQFGKASALEPQNPEPHFYMAKAYYKKDKRDYKNPIQEYEEVVKLAPNSTYGKIARREIKKLKRLQRIWRKFWGK